ncbi:TPR repeat protein [Entamoeba histolytica HM-1:IMSS-B]|uniref:TPR repeat protein n=5 Tax=Entamoeba histolytica TaxID=5759 RepID=C4M6D0_ENTH1|nr:TPR repeat protein [Entamoeba histolytica HM-1:IMSS]EMH74225.1 TPR repeat protein [Entamoeba histolytica HM-1:IMSS-B]EMS12899.1 tetratricopeptide repeat protein [Entamoeba histolytica HM-3:IMSS]ENY62503.1 tetratricopeptide repeat protein [Entamoeba histolytica HM-1:IMSS-A]GAT97043.1 tpr repeat protein [Entamoeba histolytica]EAL45089.1 TPR repeat protein [Entamoeba histolytica HM-1:IMSS]|eukprot:XP_650475.1 TPR repeat protein [Entamoeba histolytica HM-1:IMSS]
MSELVALFAPEPIKLMIDPTRYVIIPRPITIQFHKLKSYFQKDPIATVQVVASLVREQRREEAQKFLLEIMTNSSLSQLSQTIERYFYIIIASLNAYTGNEQNNKICHEYLEKSKRFGDNEFAECIYGFNAFYSKKPCKDYFKRALELNKNYAPALIGLALCELKDHKDGVALSYFIQALKKQPTNVSIRCGIGRIYYSQKEIKLAIRCYESALVLDNICMDALINLSRIYWDIRTPQTVKRALELANRALMIDNKCAPAAIVLCEAAMKCNNYKVVSEFANVAINYGNEQEKIYGHFTLGRIAHQKQDFVKAKEEYNIGYLSDTKCMFPALHYRMAQVLFREKNYIQVEKILMNCLKYNGGDFDVLKLLGFTELKLNKINETIEYLEKASVFKIDYTIELIVSSLLEEKQPKKALEHYQRINEINSTVEVLNNMGCCYYFIQELIKSKECFEKALNMDKGSELRTTLLFNKGRVLEEMKLWDEANKCYQEIIKENPWYFDARIRRCYHLWDEKQYNLASQELVETIINFPNCEDAKLLLGEMLCQQGKIDDAFKIFNSVTNHNRTNLYAFLALARVMAKYGRQDPKQQLEAVKLYGKILNADPTNVLALGGLALTTAERKENSSNPIPFNVIIESLQRVNDVCPSYEVMFSMGTCYYNAHNIQMAKSIFESTLNQYGEQVEVLNGLAQCEFMLNRYKEALEHLERALKIEPVSQIVYNYQLVASCYLEEQKQKKKLYKEENEQLRQNVIGYLQQFNNLKYKMKTFEENWKSLIEQARKDQEEKQRLIKEHEEQRKRKIEEENQRKKEEEEKEQQRRMEEKKMIIEKTKKEQEMIGKRIEERLKDVEENTTEKKKKEDRKEKKERKRKVLEEEEEADGENKVSYKRKERVNEKKMEEEKKEDNIEEKKENHSIEQSDDVVSL